MCNTNKNSLVPVVFVHLEVDVKLFRQNFSHFLVCVHYMQQTEHPSEDY